MTIISSDKFGRLSPDAAIFVPQSSSNSTAEARRKMTRATSGGGGSSSSGGSSGYDGHRRSSTVESRASHHRESSRPSRPHSFHGGRPQPSAYDYNFPELPRDRSRSDLRKHIAASRAAGRFRPQECTSITAMDDFLSLAAPGDPVVLVKQPQPPPIGPCHDDGDDYYCDYDDGDKDYGMLGLVERVRNGGQDKFLGLGADLECELDLRQDRPLCTSLDSLWTRPAMDAILPPFYFIPNLQPPGGLLRRLSTDNLFYIFYAMTRDPLQVETSHELYERGWIFHKRTGMWFTNLSRNNRIRPDIKVLEGLFRLFDPVKWSYRETSTAISRSEVWMDPHDELATEEDDAQQEEEVETVVEANNEVQARPPPAPPSPLSSSTSAAAASYQYYYYYNPFFYPHYAGGTVYHAPPMSAVPIGMAAPNTMPYEQIPFYATQSRRPPAATSQRQPTQFPLYDAYQ